MKEDAAALHGAAQRVLDAVAGAVVGQRASAEALLVAYMANGHALLEGVPGVGKTLLARAAASALGLQFARVQFTPDLMPGDVLGANVFDPGAREFRLVRGPVFAQMLMADEINRTPPKTQSALLEAMQERQASIDGVTHPLDAAFFVVATQNPIEFEGTYPLPEAQLDRFLLRIEVPLPAEEHEMAIYRDAVEGRLAGWQDGALPAAAVDPGTARALRRAARLVHVAPEVLSYAAALVRAVRSSPHVELAVSPRGALSLIECARAAALLDERDYATPDDLRRFLAPAWAHRLILGSESELEGHTPRGVLDAVARAVGVPH